MQVEIPSIIASNFEIRLSAFSFAGVDFPATSIEALPDRVQYLVMNLKSRRLHTLARIMGEASLVLARVETDTEGVVDVIPCPLSRPRTRIPEAAKKIRSGQAVRVNAYGTSLVENGAGTDGWLRLLFDTGEEDTGLRVAGDVRLVCHAVGGTNAHYTVALLGRTRAEAKEASSRRHACDLVIVGLLPNGGDNRLELFESVVRKFRGQGLEVVLLTDNAHRGEGRGDTLWADGEFVGAMAERYGCALADTAAYMEEAEQRGGAVYADTIHQSPLGHRAWAEAVSAVIAPCVDEEAQGGLPGCEAAAMASICRSELTDVEALVDFEPVCLGAKPVRGVPENRIARLFMGGDGNSQDLEPGGTLIIPSEGAVDIIFDASRSFTGEIQEQGGGEVLKCIEYAAPAGSPEWSVRPVARTVVSLEEATAARAPYTLKVVGGTLRLYGVSYLRRA